MYTIGDYYFKRTFGIKYVSNIWHAVKLTSHKEKIEYSGEKSNKMKQF